MIDEEIKKTIDDLQNNCSETYFNTTIKSLKTPEEFEYYFHILTNLWNYNAKSPANVTWFYEFFRNAPDISIPIVLKYVINNKLYNGWATLILRGKRSFSDEIFKMWLECYEFDSWPRIIKTENTLNILTPDQLKDLIYYFKEYSTDENFITCWEYIELFKENIEKFEFMKPELYSIFYEITHDEEYLPKQVQDIFIF